MSGLDLSDGRPRRLRRTQPLRGAVVPVAAARRRARRRLRRGRERGRASRGGRDAPHRHRDRRALRRGRALALRRGRDRLRRGRVSLAGRRASTRCSVTTCSSTCATRGRSSPACASCSGRAGACTLRSRTRATPRVWVPLAVRGRFAYAPAGLLDVTHLRFFARRDAEDLVRGAGFEVTAVDHQRPDTRPWPARAAGSRRACGPSCARSTGTWRAAAASGRGAPGRGAGGPSGATGRARGRALR